MTCPVEGPLCLACGGSSLAPGGLVLELTRKFQIEPLDPEHEPLVSAPRFEVDQVQLPAPGPGTLRLKRNWDCDHTLFQMERRIPLGPAMQVGTTVPLTMEEYQAHQQQALERRQITSWRIASSPAPLLVEYVHAVDLWYLSVLIPSCLLLNEPLSLPEWARGTVEVTEQAQSGLLPVLV